MSSRVLVVDDEPAVRGMISGILDRSGYTTVLADGAIQALTQLQDDPSFDLILSDVMMPEVDGLTLLDELGVDYPGVPVVLCTGIHDIHLASTAFRRGAVDYLLKPFEAQQLLAVVARGVEYGRIRRQSYLYRQNLEQVISTRTSRLRETMKELERSYDSTLEAMGDALDLRDAETEGHCKRVTAYTVALARQMGMNDHELRIIARGAFLHDIGKIATPDAILLKPGKLNPEELAIMRQHCERGYEIVRKMPFLQEASSIVLAHQERFDGTGYPYGLKGDAIPLGARIFTLADTLDAITSDRPYRKGRSFEEARQEIARWSGKQFDPAIVRVFLQIPVERWLELRSGLSHRLPEILSGVSFQQAVLA